MTKRPPSKSGAKPPEGIGNHRVIQKLLTLLEAKDPYTRYHSHNVSWYSRLISDELALSPKEAEATAQACLLHDIGKITISDTILNKPGALDEKEWQIMHTHTHAGAEIVHSVGGKAMKHIAEMVRQEHERWDGTGYPDGLKGDQIALGAQIMSVADAFDVITSKRSYKEVQSWEFGVSELKRCRGTQFSPRIVDAFLSLFEKKKDKILRFIEINNQNLVTNPRFKKN